jgi:hypothetical protein
MKKVGLIIFCLHVCITSALCQDSLKKLYLGIDYAMGNTAIGKRNIYPSLTLSKGKHSVFAGPNFLYPYNFNSYRPIYGVQAGYQFYPNGRNKRFDLFFEYNFSYVKGSVIDQSWSQSGQYRRGIEIEALDSYLGFGFKANITKRFYFHSSVGLGGMYYGQKNTYKYFSGSEYTEELDKRFYYGNWSPYSWYYNYYPSVSLIGIVKIGIAYDLFKL